MTLDLTELEMQFIPYKWKTEMPNDPRRRTPLPKTGTWVPDGETEVLREVDGEIKLVKVKTFKWVPDPPTHRQLF